MIVSRVVQEYKRRRRRACGAAGPAPVFDLLRYNLNPTPCESGFPGIAEANRSAYNVGGVDDGLLGMVATKAGDVIMVRGRQDPALSSSLSKEEAERLRVAGIAYRTISYSGGHAIDEDTLRKLSVASR